MDERRIFAYHDGRCEAWGDPLAILGELTLQLGGRPQEVIERRRQRDDPVASELARRELVAAAREAFGMAPFDRLTGEGALDEDCERVLNDYLGWLKKKGTSTASPPTSAPPTAPAFASVPGLSPTTPKSDCGCS